MATESQTLLICSVGGAPEPVVHSLLHWRPARALFLPSEKTRHTTDVALRDYAERVGEPIPAGAWEQYVLADEEDFTRCVEEMRRALEPEVARWRSRGGDFRVIVDFTGGTKCMSAALALVARRWPCEFSYVGGERRDKGGIGVVEPGSEHVLRSTNPWDALGYQALEDAVTVFNQGGYAAAAHLLDNAIRNAAAPVVKRELATLKAVVDAYAAWDRFDHRLAVRRLDDALKNRNDLLAVFTDGTALCRRLEHHRQQLEQLALQAEPTIDWVLDLLDNARRRASEGRFDDAVARLYRAFEALAQVTLRHKYGIADTKDVGLDQLPESLRQEWANRGRDGRRFMLGLQDAYRVLKELNDELGRAFFDAGLSADAGSPLVARNTSILAHGFQPVGQSVYEQLHERLLKLLRVVPAGAAAKDVRQADWSLPWPAVARVPAVSDL